MYSFYYIMSMNHEGAIFIYSKVESVFIMWRLNIKLIRTYGRVVYSKCVPIPEINWGYYPLAAIDRNT